jgi:protease II
MANDSEEIDDSEIEMQVWYVSPDEDGKPNRIVFDDSDEMLQYAHDVLDGMFDRLGEEDEEDCEIFTIEQSKTTRGEWRAIINMKAENNEPA